MKFKMRPTLSILFAFLASLSFSQNPTPFSQTVLTKFDVWDTDRDGILEPREITHATLNPTYRDQNAAALAALHSWLSAAKDTPALTKTWFQSYRPVRQVRTEKPLSADEARAARKAREASPDSLQSVYTAALKRIRSAPTDLFIGQGPDLADIKQGALGNCFMLAPLGAIVQRSPDDVRKMLVPTSGGYLVRFGDGKEVKIAAPTPAELGMGGSSMKSGLWVRVMEKAFGSRNIAEDDEDEVVARDGNRGGNTGRAGSAFTGHAFRAIRLVGDYQKSVSDADLASTLTDLRKSLPDALKAHRLGLVSTAKRGTPTSINPNHAYAIMGFDPASDRITLWNPHGNDFTPKGPDGFQYGFRRMGGQFSMPLTDFVRAFARTLIETENPAPVKKAGAFRLN